MDISWIYLVLVFCSPAFGQLQCWSCLNCESGFNTGIQQPIDCPIPFDFLQKSEENLESRDYIELFPTIDTITITTTQNPTANIRYACYRIFTQEQEALPSVLNRGCLQLIGSNVQGACLAANRGILPRDCQICTSNRCNRSVQLTVSILVLLTGLLTAYISR